MKYFGTDGIRGEYGGECVNEKFFEGLGAAVSGHLRLRFPQKPLPKIAIAGDTRFSSEKLKAAFCAGLRGAEVEDFGCVPTPALAFGVLERKADFGVMITASHNPYTDNGIKFFDENARKASDEAQTQIEELFDAKAKPAGEEAIVKKIDMRSRYIEKMGSILPPDCLRGMKIALDCANGATAGISGEVLRGYGAEVFEIGVSPDGRNINDNIGSEHPEALSELVKRTGAFVGLAHDGDGDRLVVCDEAANKIPGECVMGLVALQAKRQNSLKGGAIVTTVQSNIGLDESLKKSGIGVFRSGVGDRLVMRMMLEKGCEIGGENSGHYIFMDISPCGDGLAAAVKLLSTIISLKIKVSEMGSVVSLYPSIQKALKVARKTPIDKTQNLSKAIARIEEKMSGRGRVLVRYSGTENKIRLLVEGADSALNEASMRELIESAEIDLQ
ncbi:MAG: phosphoglucosamine mutase [Opitutales bacterium]|nr:phosphoglucosamine mutase [Opitutales bacterium]